MAERAAGAEMLSMYFHIIPPLQACQVVLHNDVGNDMPLRSETIFSRNPPGSSSKPEEEGAALLFPHNAPVELPGEGEFIYWHPDCAIEVQGDEKSAVLRGSKARINFDARSWKFFSLLEKPVLFGSVIYNCWLSPSESRRLVLSCLEKNLVRSEHRPVTACPSDMKRCHLPPQVAAFLSCRNEGAGECTMRINDGLYRSRRGDKVLVVDPDSASWAVIPGRHDAVLQTLRGPLPFSRICSSFPSCEPSSMAELLQKMYYHGFISIDGRTCFPAPEIMWQPLDDRPLYPRSFYLHMTDACNFRCTYCYAKAETKGRTMSFPVAARIIDRVVAEIPFEELYFEFHGGEPLLMKEEIDAIVRYGKSAGKGKRIHFSLQTNGSLLDDEVIRWAKHWKVQVGISIDGPASVHDLHRKMPDGSGTFTKVWKSIQRAWQGGLEPGFMAVINEGADYLKAYEFFVSSGILSFKANYRASLGRAASDQEDPGKRGEDLASGFLAMVDEAANFNSKSPCRVRIHDLNLYLAALMGKKREYMCLRSPCGAGRSLLAFGPEGEIYPCEEMSTYPEFMCGSIDSAMPLTELIDSSSVILRLRERRVENIPRCSTCPWRRFCGGRCLHKAYHYFGDSMREDPMCAFYRTIFEELMWRIDADPRVLTLL